MKRLRFLPLAGILLVAVGCTDTSRASLSSIGEPHDVEVYSGGQKILSVRCTGVPHSEEASDGYLCKDASTGEVVRFSGDVVMRPTR